MRAFVVFLLFSAAVAARAADIGGWFEQQRRAELRRDECPELLTLAARTPPDAAGAAELYYAGALCHLYSDLLQPDPVAARAWLVRAAELDHPLAQRSLLALSDPSTEVAAHPAAYHCHDLGLGRTLCHGGVPRQ